MSVPMNEESVANFASISGVDLERAKFYLESSGWNLDIAMNTFYDDLNDDPETGTVDPAADAASREEAAAAPEPDRASQRPPPVSQPKPRIATLANIGAASGSDTDDSEEGQTFYAGGSERGGGQQIIGPKKKNADKVVKDVFESAQKHGAESVEAGSSSSEPRRSGMPSFRGTGYRLGETEEAPVQRVQGGPLQKQRKVDMVLKMWKNGFSVDDGPLRDYNDPANMQFISCIKKGEIPPELTMKMNGGEVNLDMEDHRTEEYAQPKVSVRAFGGEGNRLGSVAPPVAAAGAPPAEAQSNATAAQTFVAIDASKPVTNVQIRLADGGRLVAKFNHDHTVADIRTFIQTAHPQYTGVNYALMTTFPSSELADHALTLENAKLLNSSIVQRMK